MELKEQPTAAIDRRINDRTPLPLTDIHDACADRIAELSPVVQDQAGKFLRFVETLLAGITGIAWETCRKYFEQINNCPKKHDKLVSSHLEHMALLIDNNVDIIYEGLHLSTIDHMQQYIDRIKSGSTREPYYSSDSQLPF